MQQQDDAFDPDDRSGPTTTLPVIDERVHVAKRIVARGGYRLSKRVEVRDETVDVALREDRVDIERRPIGRLLEPGEVPVARDDDGTMVYPVVEEVVVTEIRLMLREEIRVTRTSGTRHALQTVSLRKEDISIERLDDDVGEVAPTVLLGEDGRSHP